MLWLFDCPFKRTESEPDAASWLHYNDNSVAVSYDADASSELDIEDSSDKYWEDYHDNDDDKIQAQKAKPWLIEDPTIK